MYEYRFLDVHGFVNKHQHGGNRHKRWARGSSDRTTMANSKCEAPIERLVVEFDVELPLKVLFLTDSRGRGLQQYIRSKFSTVGGFAGSQLEFTSLVSVHPGKTIDFLLAEAHRFEQFRVPDLTVFQGGICNFTHREQINNKQVLLYSRKNQITEFLSVIYNIRQRYGNKALIATIVPACLIKFYTIINKETPDRFMLKLLQQQQKDLLEDLKYVNTQIINGNKHLGVRTIDLHDKVFNVSLKKSKNKSKTRKLIRFVNTNLEDGLHPNEYLRLLLHERSFDSVIKYIEQKKEVNIEFHQSSSNESDDTIRP